MATLVLRSQKGSPLTFNEVDSNFTALNDELATATDANTPSTPVKRDASGNFAAGTITANLSGNVTGNLTGTASAIADNTVTSAKIVDGTIVNADINASAAIGLSKLATGALPTAITVASANIVDGTIVNADVNASAAIAGTKISPNFGSQNVVTTGTSTAASLIPTGSSVPTNGVYLPDANSVGISTNGSASLTVGSAGAVTVNRGPLVLAGYGTEGGQLEIGNPENTGVVYLFDANTATNARLFTTNNNTNLQIGQIVGTGGRIQFHTSGSERMRLDSDGRLGLGTSSPDEKCHIQDSTTAGTIKLGRDYHGIVRQDANSLNIISNGDQAFRVGLGTNNGSGNILFKTAQATTGNTTRMVITAGGNVGIGTTSPGGQLQVNSPASTVAFMALSATADPQYPSYGFSGQIGSNGGRGAGMYLPADSTLAFSTTGIERLRLDSGGTFRVKGAGTAGVTDAFAVNGSAPASSAQIDSSGRLLVGTSTSVNQFGVTPQLQLTGTSGAGGYLGLTVFNTAQQSAPNLVLGHSKGASVGVYTASVANDLLGEVSFTAGNGTDMRRGASIGAWAEDAWAVSDHPARLVFSTTADGASGPTERMRITSGGDVGIGTTSPGFPLEVAKDNGVIGLIPNAANGNTIRFGGVGAGANQLIFTGASDIQRARIDSSGRLLVGTSADITGATTTSIQVRQQNGPSALALGRGGTSIGGGQVLGRVNFYSTGGDGSTWELGAAIEGMGDGTHSTGSKPTRLVFSTTADGASSPTERMRISNGGSIIFGNSSEAAITAGSASGKFYQASDTNFLSSRTGTSSVSHFSFINSNGVVGNITTSGSATAYNTSSDYRLKENVVPLTGAIDRLQQIPVHRFNFIADPDRTIDGFIAHEAQEIVPECVTGTKDEVDEDGNPVYQGIDQSKLVPLLTAALQEALAKIETLEARLDAAGIS